MKSLIRKIFKKNFVISLRNNLNIFPIKINTNNLDINFSISDSFTWRTDKKFKTIFKFKDLLNYFYADETKIVNLKFYSKEGFMIKNLKNIKISEFNSLTIDQKFMNGIEDYGTFTIFHKSKNYTPSIRNSCYTGFSYDNRSYVYVHGNLPTSAELLYENEKKIFKNIIGKSLFINQFYKIQNRFDGSDFVELFLHNPCNSEIKFKIREKKYSLSPNSSRIIKLKTQEITIRSNCYLLRPIIFNYKKNILDVFHG